MANCIILNGGTETPPNRSQIQRTLGAYRIASTLEDNGYTTFVLDHLANLSVEEIKQAIIPHLGEDTLWFGFSSTFVWQINKKTNDGITRVSSYGVEDMYYHLYQEITDLINFVKTESNAKIIYGGARSPFFLLDDNIDYYVFGYADTSVLDVTNYLSNRSSSIQHVNEVVINNKICYTVDSGDYPEPSMDNISTHWWNKNFNILKEESLPIELGRGCIFKCKFCNFHLTGKKKGTYTRDVEEVRDELIRIWETHGTTNYWFTDDTFNDDNDKLDTLHKLFTSLPFKPKFSTYLRIDLINRYPHQADLLEEMGMIGTFFGIETLQPKSAVAIGKGLHPTKVKDRLYWLHDKWKNKINIGTGFILGLPYDDMQYFYELITWAIEKDNPIQSIQFYPLMLYYYGKEHPEWDKYSSEFSLNPDIYGYKMKPGNATSWSLPEQGLTHKMCLEIANQYNNLRGPMNKVAGFEMITMLNLNIDFKDLFHLTELEIQKKYDIPKLNNQRIIEYKNLLGLK